MLFDISGSHRSFAVDISLCGQDLMSMKEELGSKVENVVCVSDL